ncbi:MAG: phosphoribosylamine--glycine ligase [Parvimonas micra]|uniref:phosphoribosylamine--glycine ligase n=1 Tax=Parvimonas micra TaxID=33033 RepID=UPI002003F4B1|nr:phosphoribosylamine--glycine ligase [Parvimonas micra]MCK6129839.1 phosphoribosylamine--glycine ligase [Parvimonas micra]MCK6135485.1 phosphoribosylamine--glycine ligase [Parvimonas micra]MCK6136957.1 phosphoribosylamine--glycine ligase [Parvimonas micra]MCK6153484.1 phosphoribosylamine--glycine ligase [Parvimonas micra]
MKVLVIGNGGREDAICKKISESNKCTELFCSKGNAGTLRYAENVELNSNEEIFRFSNDNNIDLVVVGPEAPLCEGIVDLFKESNIKVFGADKKSARLEGSKDFAKKFMKKYDVPTARYETIKSIEEGKKAIENFSYPIVIKADGLCAGKGVRICNTKEDVLDYFKELFEDKIFGKEGSTVVIEEFLRGKEASLLCFVSKGNLIPMESARDYKRIFDNDEGENTGGVGCYSPSELFNEELKLQIEKILEKISNGLKKENLEYSGVLFIGFMIDEDAKVLEFNVRFGDPETEVVLPRMESDLLLAIEKSLDGSLEREDLKWKKEKCLTVILTSRGYPKNYEKGKEISGIDSVDKDIYVYHNNTKVNGSKILTDGGRVLSVTALGNSYDEIREKVYRNIEKISFETKQYRKDIGKM